MHPPLLHRPRRRPEGRRLQEVARDQQLVCEQTKNKTKNQSKFHSTFHTSNRMIIRQKLKSFFAINSILNFLFYENDLNYAYLNIY